MFDALGDVFLAASILIVAGTAVASITARVIARRRLKTVVREFPTVSDAQLLVGLRELRNAVLAEQRRDRR